MKVMAYYGTRRGGSGGRPVSTAADAEKILKGGYGVTNVRLETPNGGIVGMRFWEYVDGKWQWIWFYDQDYFK